MRPKARWLAHYSGPPSWLEESETAEPVFVNLLRSPGIDFQSGGIEFLESIPGLHKRLQVWVQGVILYVMDGPCRLH